jgi:hypothetical protein
MQGVCIRRDYADAIVRPSCIAEYDRRWVRHIFGIGLNKTGTTSLVRALRILGYEALHHREAVEEAIRRAHRDGVPLLSYAPNADAYLDVRAVETWFDFLDQQYPKSRFILTTRDLEGWLDSRERHVLRNQVRAEKGAYDGQWLTVDRENWTREWHEHHNRVRSYFAGRENFLEMDITAGEGWEVLVPFLGLAAPSQPFPWLRRSPPRTSLERVARRVQRLFR